MKILIAGTGGVGGYFGGVLKNGGMDVSFLARGENLKALKKDGLIVKSVRGDFAVSPQETKAFSEIIANKKFDIILVCVKAHQTKDILPLVQSGIGERTRVISLQNGIDRHKELIRAFGAPTVAGGLCYLGAHLEGPGVIRHVAAGRVFVGGLNGKDEKILKDFVAKARKSHLDIEYCEDIKKKQWEKLVWNVGLNGPTALVDVTVGEILKMADQRDLIEQLMVETVAVAQAAGFSLDKDLPQKTMDYSEKEMGSIETSMLIDRRQGRRMEWEIFHGFVSSEGKRLGVTTPANDLMGNLLQGVSGGSN